MVWDTPSLSTKRQAVLEFWGEHDPVTIPWPRLWQCLHSPASLKSSRCDTSRQSAQLWNSQSPKCQPFSSNSIDSSCGGLAMSAQNVPGKTGGAIRAGSPTGKRPRVRPSNRWRDYISDLSWSRLGAEPAESSEIAFDREVFRAATFFRGKSGHENEWKNEHLKFNTWWCTDQVIFLINPTSRFCFHSNKSRLSASTCLQELHTVHNVVGYVEISMLQ